jgi:hypothetical protein
MAGRGNDAPRRVAPGSGASPNGGHRQRLRGQPSSPATGRSRFTRGEPCEEFSPGVVIGFKLGDIAGLTGLEGTRTIFSIVGIGNVEINNGNAGLEHRRHIADPVGPLGLAALKYANNAIPTDQGVVLDL